MQPSFFDQDTVHTKLDRLKDPLVTINEIVDWDGFRETLERIRPQTDTRQGGRPPLDAVLMVKMIFLRHYYDLSLKQAEYQVLDRLSFRRFLGLNLKDPIPDTNTVWVYEERLIEHDLIHPLFRDLMAQIEAASYLRRGGQIIDATLIEAPLRRNEPSGHDDDQGGQGRSDAQRQQANRNAHWTRKHGQSYFSYKDYLGVDSKHKLIRTFEVTPSNRYDSHLLADLLDPDNSNGEVWAPQRRKRSHAGAAQLYQPDHAAQAPQQAPDKADRAGQPQEGQGASPGRTCLWRRQAGRTTTVGAKRRTGPGNAADRHEEPGLQHPAIRLLADAYDAGASHGLAVRSMRRVVRKPPLDGEEEALRPSGWQKRRPIIGQS
ncbi:IS5 family transposase [Chromohalobacter sp. 296-RDG]|uniref:IS5 family transposase n=1 Tax=Chromohalobacter sp. 296-RDG TaxID=2994062 RepID=UPI00246853A0|nr:IS5 family transposase [Chromohalobacter sp. 296-RDG]